MKKKRINQLIAIRKGIKAKAVSNMTSWKRMLSHAASFNGFTKTYRPKADDGETFPPERKKVQNVATDLLKEVARAESDFLNIEASMEWSNLTAAADVVVNGNVLMDQAPVTFLLLLEKRLVEYRNLIETFPVLDEAQDWNKDPNSDLFRTEKLSSHKTRKVEEDVIIVPATENHPAQWRTRSTDIVVGYWDTVRLSGAMPVPQKKALLERISTLIRAVKMARAEANAGDAVEKQVGDAIFGYLFS